MFYAVSAIFQPYNGGAHVFDMNKQDCNTETCLVHQLEPLKEGISI